MIVASSTNNMTVVRWHSVIMLFVGLCLLQACTAVGKKPADLPSVLVESSWILQLPKNNTGAGTAAKNVQALIETQLRTHAIEQITLADTEQFAVRGAGDGSGRKYRLSGILHQWHTQTAMDRFPTIDLELMVTDSFDGRILWQGRHKATNRLSATLSGAADDAAGILINDLLRTLAREESQRTNSSFPVDVTATTAPLMGGPALHSSNPVLPVVALPTALRSNAAGGLDTALSSSPVVGESLAIFYGADLPLSILAQFDRVVLEPDNVDTKQLNQIKGSGAVAYAYLSIGEVGPTRKYAATLNPAWALGTNEAWDSQVMDLAAPGWQDFLARRIDSLVASGFSGLFLDTLDSYVLIAVTEEDRKRQQDALTSIIRNAKLKHPQLRLIANRGFEVLDQIGSQLEAVAAESLFKGWDNTHKIYREVPNNDREWLLSQLDRAVRQFNLEAIVIDYMPPEQREEALVVAAAIADRGFTPWVSTPALDSVGIGSLQVMPREVMLLYDSRNVGPVEDSQVHRLVATPLEYFGYVPVYHDLATDALPAAPLHGRIAGIVSWFDRPVTHPDYQLWLSRQIQSGVPVAVLGHTGINVNPQLTELIGLAPATGFSADTGSISHRDGLIGFEREPIPRLTLSSDILVNQHEANRVHLGYVDEAGGSADTVVTGPWGGIAVNPSVIDVDPSGTPYWIIDPFAFLRTALRLRAIPMPDVTTLNGNRLWFAHIDGDALPSWAEMPGRRLGAEVIYADLLERYRYPHSVSVVEAEMIAMGRVADRRKRMFTVMRKIFREPYVEPASHTYSHPFKWGKIGGSRSSGTYNLKIDGYRFSPERELLGSLAFINEKLLPKNKQANTIFWSGDALPTAETLRVAESNGLINLNGGNTVISSAIPSVSAITPMARIVDDQVQVYAPIMNENVYTNDWTGPFDGFRDVIETLKMTDHPRRIKPQNIYYHFYSGTKIAAMRAMREVYDWSLAQDINPVFASEYARLVPAWRKAGVAQYLDGTWKVSALGPIRSIRILDQRYWPHLDSTSQLTGVRQLHDGMYLHSGGDETVLFKLRTTRPAGPYLVASNGQVEYWRKTMGSVRFRIRAHVPLVIELAGARGCSIQTAEGTLQGQIVRGQNDRADRVRFSFKSRDSADAILNCQA